MPASLSKPFPPALQPQLRQPAAVGPVVPQFGASPLNPKAHPLARLRLALLEQTHPKDFAKYRAQLNESSLMPLRRQVEIDLLQ